MRGWKAGLTGGLLALAALAAWWVLGREQPPEDIVTGPTASAIPRPAARNPGELDKLPPTAAGIPSSRDLPATEAPAASTVPDPLASLPPLKDPLLAHGRVERVYVRLAQGVLVELSRAVGPQRDGWRYAEIGFTEPLANGASRAMALLSGGLAEVSAGDVVEMRFASRGPQQVQGMRGSFFMGIERDRVTQLLGKSGTALAQAFERRREARWGPDPALVQAQPVAWKSLPLERAVRIVHGTGSRQVALFSDPNCVACQALEQTLEQLDDVTVHVFMVPLIRPELAQQSRSVWCSPDRARAWLDLTLRHQAPSASPGCDNPLDQLLSMQAELVDLRVTPTLIFQDGQRLQGSVSLPVLRERLAAAAGASVAQR